MEQLPSSIRGKMGSRPEDWRNAVVPLLKLISVTLIGLLLAHPKTQIVPRSTFKLLSKLVFALFLPCLIFTNLGKSISLENITLWWFIPVNVLLSTLLGCGLGFLVAILCRPPPRFFRFVITMTAFGNTGNLALAIVGSVCRSDSSPFGPSCYQDGVSYVSFAQWVSVILVYTLVYHMMEPPPMEEEYYEVAEEDEEEGGGEIEVEEPQPPRKDLSRPLLVEAEWPGIEDKETAHCKTPFIANVFSSTPDFDQPSHPESIRCLAEPKMVRRMRIVAEQTPVVRILQPPTIASLLAIVIGLVPQLKTFVYGDDAPLSFLTESLEILAAAAVPSMLLVLGGMLAEGPNESNSLGVRTTIGIIVARLLVLPLLGIGVVFVADKSNCLVAGDDMYRFVLLLQYTTPSAILLGAIASLRGYAVSEASALLFWQHVFAIASLSVYLIVYFKLLVSYV